MKRMFNLCLMASLLATFGAACSKKTNSRAKEVIAAENALKEKKAVEDKLKAKEAEEAQKLADAQKTEEEEKARLANIKLKQDNAVEVGMVLLKGSDDRASNLAIYQLILSSQLSNLNLVSAATENKDAEGHADGKNKSQELVSISADLKKDTSVLCNEILKRTEKKADSDLVSLDKDKVQSDVDGVVEYRSLNIVSNYIEVGTIREMCTKIREAIEIEKKNAELQKIAEEKALKEKMDAEYAADADKAKDLAAKSPEELREQAQKLIEESVTQFDLAETKHKEYSELRKTRKSRRDNKDTLTKLNEEILRLRAEGNAKAIEAEKLKDLADELENKAE